jgi:hypothetical protein
VHFDTILSNDNFSIISNFKLCTSILIFSTEIDSEKIDQVSNLAAKITQKFGSDKIFP